MTINKFTREIHTFIYSAFSLTSLMIKPNNGTPYLRRLGQHKLHV